MNFPSVGLILGEYFFLLQTLWRAGNIFFLLQTLWRAAARLSHEQDVETRHAGV
jgi:hypothetical protein